MIAAKCHNQSQEANPTFRKWFTEARQTGESDNYAGKRRQRRCTWDAQITIEVLENGEPTATYYANTRDISTGGMGMRCRKAVPAHAEVRITIDETGESVQARVTQCTEGICGYHIGVEFTAETQATSTPAERCKSETRATVDIRFPRFLQTRAA